MMAVVALGKPIKTNLDGATGAMAYIINPSKTDGGRLVSSNYETSRTDWHRLAQPMMDDNQAAPKGIRKNSRLAYHLKMSFDPSDPVTAEQVHELGIEFARRVTGDNYKFVVATHTDHAHLHNHIMVCAAARESPHLKAELPKDIIDQWRELCDEICKREGLSVIDKPIELVPTPETGDLRAVESDEKRHGYSMAELYSTIKGQGVKDEIRTLVEIAAINSKDFAEWRSNLEASGVDVEIRGQHLTFQVKASGFKVRDSKLGPAYRLTPIMARIGGEKMLQIVFNEHLIAKQTDKTVTVWLPGTKRQRKITIPKTHVLASGSTWRAFIPADRKQPIIDRRGRYVEHVRTARLYQWFGQPTEKIQPLATPERLPIRAGVTPEQQRYYAGQAKRLDRLQEAARALNTAVKWTRLADGDTGKAVALLRAQVRENRADLQASVVALHEAIANSDRRLAVETYDEMTQRERNVAAVENELASLEHAIDRAQENRGGQSDKRNRGRR